jgi:hypothetical protein
VGVFRFRALVYGSITMAKNTSANSDTNPVGTPSGQPPLGAPNEADAGRAGSPPALPTVEGAPPLGAPVQPPPLAPPPGFGGSPPSALVGGGVIEDPTAPGAKYRGNDTSNPANAVQARALAEANDDRTSRFMVMGDQTYEQLINSGDILVVRSKNDRFRRAGMAFTRAWQKVNPRDLSPNQLEALLDEPMLEARRTSEYEADRYLGVVDAGTAAEFDSAPRAALLSELTVARTERDQYRRQVEELTQQLAGERAPKGDSKVLASDRSTSPLPNPPERKTPSAR